ncbi:unnamed protein product, partial [Prorocentrum cordatum]
FGTAASLWLIQANYHKAKEGKSRMDFDGFRVLALCSVEECNAIFKAQGRPLVNVFADEAEAFK